MGVTDADTHIDETEDTWAWIAEHAAQYMPQPDAPKVLESFAAADPLLADRPGTGSDACTATTSERTPRWPPASCWTPWSA